MRRKLSSVVLSSVALFLLMGVVYALSPVVPYLVEDGPPASADSPSAIGTLSSDTSHPEEREDITGSDPLAAELRWVPGVIDPRQVGLSAAAGAGQMSPAPGEPEAPGETAGPNGADASSQAGEPDKTDEPSQSDGAGETDEPSKADEPSQTDEPSETDSPDETGEPSQADGTGDTGEPSQADGPDEAGEAGGSDEPAEPNEAGGPSESGAQMLPQQNVGGQTYVSLSAAAQSVDPYAQVGWDGRTMTVTSGGTTVTATSGRIYVVANGRYLYAPNGVQIIDGQVYIPDTVAVKAFSGLQDGDSFYDQSALFWLSRVIQRESGNQSLEGQMAVGNVIVNRVAASAFPDSIEGVLAQENQFPSYHSGLLQQTDPSASSVIAAKLVLDGGVVEAVRGATFFSSSSDSWAARNKQFIATFGGHNFYG